MISNVLLIMMYSKGMMKKIILFFSKLHCKAQTHRKFILKDGHAMPTRKDQRVRSLAFDFPATSSSISTSELMLADLASNRGWTDLEGDAVLKVLKDRSFNISEISSNSMRALFHKINSDSAAEPEFEEINLWKEGYGQQKVELFIRDLKSVF